jgi:hypothetical protein
LSQEAALHRAASSFGPHLGVMVVVALLVFRVVVGDLCLCGGYVSESTLFHDKLGFDGTRSHGDHCCQSARHLRWRLHGK